LQFVTAAAGSGASRAGGTTLVPQEGSRRHFSAPPPESLQFICKAYKQYDHCHLPTVSDPLPSSHCQYEQ
jgi:hypothetical protein